MSRMAANSVWQLTSFGCRAVAGLGTVVLLARSGGPDSLGLFQYALMLTALLPYYFGLPSLLAREVARRPDEGKVWVEAGTLIALAFGAIFSIVFVIGSMAVGATETTTMAVAIASIGMAFDGVARVQFAAFWAWERMRLEAVVTAAQELAFFGGVAIVVLLDGSVTQALLAFCLSRALGALLGWALASRQVGTLLVPRGRPAFVWKTVRQSSPFAVNDTLTLTNGRVDTVLLGMFKGSAAVGLYQAGTTLVLNLNVFARSINRALYPRLSRAWPGNLKGFRELRDTSFRAVALIAVPATVGSFLLAGPTMNFLFGAAFDDAVVTYQLLVLVIPIRMLGHTLSLALAAADRQGQRVRVVGFAAVLNVLVNLVTIPQWSYLGAAIATVISESVLFLGYGILLHRAAGRSDLFRSLNVPLAASVPMGLAVVATRGSGLLVSAAVGAAVYIAGVAALAWTRDPKPLTPRPWAIVSVLLKPTS